MVGLNVLGLKYDLGMREQAPDLLCQRHIEEVMTDDGFNIVFVDELTQVIRNCHQARMHAFPECDTSECARNNLGEQFWMLKYVGRSSRMTPLIGAQIFRVSVVIVPVITGFCDP
ncbi:MAG: hypothetical protein C0519_05525 [Hyphomicrobium sp.]|nr:hypothetical protein [Hyphomicrobium sp.]PPD07616.1 MAG: hypothetical protein CTY28_09085 [Hyphomicrobium sp.]